MKLQTIALISAFFVCVGISRAEITTWNCGPDSDGVISLDSPVGWYDNTSTGEYELTMDASHTRWEAGHMIGWFNSPDGDPTIKVTNEIDNDTDMNWTDYHINIYMDNPFTILPGSAFVTSPSFWTSVITPVSGTGPYVGSIDYYAGDPVLASPPGTLIFGYKISFATVGVTTYTQEMMPTPEPGTFVMLAFGLMGLLILRRRFA